jgi:hypothetical protein
MGAPNLTHPQAFIYGSSFAQLQQTIRYGRQGQMPAQANSGQRQGNCSPCTACRNSARLQPPILRCSRRIRARATFARNYAPQVPALSDAHSSPPLSHDKLW